jgi:hypothetical protein
MTGNLIGGSTMSVSIQPENHRSTPASALGFISLIDLADDVSNPSTFFEMLGYCEDVPFDIKVAFAVYAAEGLASFILKLTPGANALDLTRTILQNEGFSEFVEMADTMPTTALSILNSGRRLLGFDHQVNTLQSLPFQVLAKEQVA